MNAAQQALIEQEAEKRNPLLTEEEYYAEPKEDLYDDYAWPIQCERRAFIAGAKFYEETILPEIEKTNKPSSANQAAYPSVNTSTSDNVQSLWGKKSAEFERIVKSYTEEKNYNQ